MGNLAFEVLLVLALIVANGVFAMAEAAVVASRKPRLQNRADAGDLKAAAALRLVENPDRFLSTTQIGITLIGIFSGAFGGATLSKELAAYLNQIPVLAPYADSLGLFVVVALITYFSLIIGELVPKRLAMNNPERIAASVAAPMGVLSKIAAPLVSFLAFSSSSALKLLGIRGDDGPAVTEDEIKMMVLQGAQSGTFHPTESDMIDRVFRLGDLNVAAMMTRRPDIQWLDIDAPWEHLVAQLGDSPHSRLPVCRGGWDQLLGVVRAKDVLSLVARGEKPDLLTVLEAPVWVPTTMTAFRLLETLRHKKTHLAFVVNEFGAAQGLVTLHDILEAVVGDLPLVDEADNGHIVRREDGSFLIDAMMPWSQFKEALNFPDPFVDETRFESVSGFVLMQLGRIPSVAQQFEAGDWIWEIVDMDRQRIDKILLRRAASDSNSVKPEA